MMEQQLRSISRGRQCVRLHSQAMEPGGLETWRNELVTDVVDGPGRPSPHLSSSRSPTMVRRPCCDYGERFTYVRARGVQKALPPSPSQGLVSSLRRGAMGRSCSLVGCSSATATVSSSTPTSAGAWAVHAQPSFRTVLPPTAGGLDRCKALVVSARLTLC